MPAQTSQHTPKRDLVSAFYDNPTPAGAVALARADARAVNSTPEFIHQLSLAGDQLASAPALAADCRRLRSALETARNWFEASAIRSALGGGSPLADIRAALAVHDWL